MPMSWRWVIYGLSIGVTSTISCKRAVEIQIVAMQLEKLTHSLVKNFLCSNTNTVSKFSFSRCKRRSISIKKSYRMKPLNLSNLILSKCVEPQTKREIDSRSRSEEMEMLLSAEVATLCLIHPRQAKQRRETISQSTCRQQFLMATRFKEFLTKKSVRCKLTIGKVKTAASTHVPVCKQRILLQQQTGISHKKCLLQARLPLQTLEQTQRTIVSWVIYRKVKVRLIMERYLPR